MSKQPSQPHESQPAPEAGGGGKTFTGYRRNRKTPFSILAKDQLARILITTGGLGTIAAVLLMCGFLFMVVAPLFLPSDSQTRSDNQRGWLEDSGAPVHMELDEYNLMGWAAFADGQVRKFRLDNGEVLDSTSLHQEDAELTAWAFPQKGNMVMLGYSDGSIRRAEIGFELSFMQLEDAPPELRALEVGEIASYKKQLAQMTPERQIRLVGLKVEIFGAFQTASDTPVVRLDHSGEGSSPSLVAVFADGTVEYHRLSYNRMTRSFTTRTNKQTLELRTPERGIPDFINLSGLGDNLYAIWKDGTLERYDTRRLDNIRWVETVDISPKGEGELTTIAPMIGKTTLLVGDSEGNVSSFFHVAPDIPDSFVRQRLEPLRDSLRQIDPSGFAVRVLDSLSRVDTFFAQTADPANGLDGRSLFRVQQLPGAGAGPVTSIATSKRKRMIAVGHADGMVRLHYVTNEQHLLDIDTEFAGPIERVMLNPRDDGLAIISGDRLRSYALDIEHPEASTKALLGKVWYEGYAYPTYTWQSTGGTDDFESKFSVVPLVFGTIKATFFAMLFAVPIALMAAIYTSEFLKPKIKAKVKPTIEMMASLPSVVLGFLAGLVVAQFIEDIVVAVLMAFFTIPFTFLALSQIFQMFSPQMRMRLATWRFVILILSLPIGIYLAGFAGPLVERALFWVEYPQKATLAADGSVQVPVEYSIRAWLSAHRQEFTGGELPQFHSSAIGGWMILFMPLSALASLFLMVRYANPWIAQIGSRLSWSQLAFADAGKFLVGCLLAIVVAYIASAGMSLFWDARGSFVDQYVQRNALIVGMIMGFAVIPIIYTIADDAMSAVPESLRSASLGAGATPWQTAVRVIIPTAMSGMFSACMIGFGRAVGETMIVLMALGNTPIMEWNIFNGARTLAANIAVEMMEAVQNSTNYRILFLTALILFGMTFVINTIAELIRIHYRKKAVEL